jgi:multiple antibiotic resistance protein
MNSHPLFEYILLTVSALFIAVNPLAVVPAFLAMTEGDSPAERTRIAGVATFAAGLILAFFALAGTWILKLFGLSLPAIQIAGSIVLLRIALDMMQGRRSATHETREEREAAAEKETIALMPLAVPMLADPGAISTTLIMLNKANDTRQTVVFYLCLLAVVLASFIILRLSAHGARRLSPIAQKMMARLMGLLLSAMAIQFSINALRQMGVPLTL